MRVTDVNGYAMSSPINPPQNRSFHGGMRTLHKRDVVLVEILTADGEAGYAPAGASSSAMREHFEDATQDTFAAIVNGPIADVLEGATIDEVRNAHNLLEEVSLPEQLRSEAHSAIDVALYDLFGKELGAPIYEVLREEYSWLEETEPTTDLSLYASAGMYMEPSGYAAQAATIADSGFFGYKYRPGIGPEKDLETIQVIDEAVGDRTEIMIDAHTWWKLERPYDTEERQKLFRAFEAADAYWLEEPVAPDNHEGYISLAEETSVPLAGGESELSPEGLTSLVDTGAVGFLQGDVRHHHGYSGCVEAAEYCSDTSVTFVPHNFGTWLGLVANAHLVAALPDVDLLEYPVFEDDPTIDADNDPGMYPFSLAYDILKGEPDIEGGQMTVPDGPGLGVDVNIDAAGRYPHLDGAWSTFEYY